MKLSLIHIFLRQVMVSVGRQARIVDPGHILLPLQEFRHLLRVFTVPRHAQVEGFHSIPAECLPAQPGPGNPPPAVSYTHLDVYKRQPLAPNIHPTCDLDPVKDAELIVVVVPSVAMRSVAQRLRGLPVRPDRCV